MIKGLRLGSLLLGAAFSCPIWAQPQPAPTSRAQPTAAEARVRSLYDGYAAWDAKESEQFEDARGETKPTAHLPRVDEASQLRRAAHLRDLLTQLNAIPPAQLSPGEQVNAAVFRTVLENGIGEARFRQWDAVQQR
jgi:uncharacterized protein (DUF885 family)